MKNGSVRAIRCNNDGYVVGVGVILAEWYTDIKKVKNLLALGDLFKIHEKVTDCITLHRVYHALPIKQFINVEEYQQIGREKMRVHYLYLYEKGKWAVYSQSHEKGWIVIHLKVIKEK